MNRVVELLDRKKLHPDIIITDRFPLKQASEAYVKFAQGKTGKVVITID